MHPVIRTKLDEIVEIAQAGGDPAAALLEAVDVLDAARVDLAPMLCSDCHAAVVGAHDCPGEREASAG